MNVWPCPIKPRSWKVICKLKVFGVPSSALKIMHRVKLGDLLVFHVLRPVSGIVAIAKVASKVNDDTLCSAIVDQCNSSTYTP